MWEGDSNYDCSLPALRESGIVDVVGDLSLRKINKFPKLKIRTIKPGLCLNLIITKSSNTWDR